MDSRDLRSLRSLRHENDGTGVLPPATKVRDLQPLEKKLVILDLVSERSERRVSGIHASPSPPRQLFKLHSATQAGPLLTAYNFAIACLIRSIFLSVRATGAR